MQTAVTKIKEIIWLAQLVEKIESRHGVSTDVVEQAFAGHPASRDSSEGMCVEKISIDCSAGLKAAAALRCALFLRPAGGLLSSLPAT